MERNRQLAFEFSCHLAINFTRTFLLEMFTSTLKFIFSKKATKIDEIFTVDLTVTTYCQIDGEDFFNFFGHPRKREL